MACSILCGCNDWPLHLIFGVELFHCLPAAHRDWHRYPPVHIERKRYTYSSRYRYDIYILYTWYHFYIIPKQGANQQYDPWVDRIPPTQPQPACHLNLKRRWCEWATSFLMLPGSHKGLKGSCHKKVKIRSHRIRVGWYTLVFSFR